jgi:hypothetical protein
VRKPLLDFVKKSLVDLVVVWHLPLQEPYGVLSLVVELEFLLLLRICLVLFGIFLA